MKKNDGDDMQEKLLEDLDEVVTEEENIPKQEGITVSRKKRIFIPGLHKMYWFLYRKPYYLLVFLPSLACGFIMIQSNYFMGKVIDSLKEPNPEYAVTKYSILTFLSAMFSAVMNYLTYSSWIRIGARINMKIKSMLFKSFMEKDITYYDNTYLGQMLSLLNDDAALVESVFTSSKSTQIRVIGQLCSAVFVALSIEWRLTIGSLVITIVIALMMRRFRKRGQKHFKAKLKIAAVGLTVFNEDISTPRVVYAYGQEEGETKRYYDIMDVSANHETWQHFLIGTNIETAKCVNMGTLACMISLCGYSIVKGKFSAGSSLALVRACLMFGGSIDMLVGSYNREIRAQESGSRIWDLIESEPTINPREGIEPAEFKGKIEFRHVWFKYPTREQWVLKDVSFIVNPGEIAAFVGHSGSGKSTVVQLLMRFYDVNEGEILLDGRNIKDYSPSYIHRVIGVVQQDSALFTLSVKENILYGTKNATEEDVVNAAKIANADKFIRKLPEGYESMIGEKGSTLSGGQKQRIAIARAVIKNPSILITDEATAALDSVSERKVQAALENVMKGRTSVIVAHRLGTIRSAQKIFVFDAGELVEEGTHDELIEKGGEYYDLVRLQMSESQSQQQLDKQ